MNARVRAVAVATTLMLMLCSAAAWARNPHCAGGIQYLTQALADKLRGNTDDYMRERLKAVQQLEACASEDPADFEAIGYLAWAYAEVDSMCPAGTSFQAAIEGLTSKGDKKKIEMVVNNRESFWVTVFNKGIASINTAQGLYPRFSDTPANAADETAKAGARQQYEEALRSLNKALCLKPADARSFRNLGAVYGFMGDFLKADHYFTEGLKAAPGDSDLTNAVKSARTNRAAQLIDEKQFDAAMDYYTGLLKDDPNNGDLWAGLGEAASEKGRGSDSLSKKASYARAGDAFAKAGELKPGVFELPFNAAIGYYAAGNLSASERQWRAALKVKPDSRDAMLELGRVLGERKLFPEAIATVIQAIKLDPKDPTGHHQLGNLYNAAGDNLHSRQALLAFLALQKGKVSEAATAAAGAGGSQLQAGIGKPDLIVLWQADNQNYETWFYWAKGQAFHFEGGTQLEKSEWNAVAAAK